jgi:hypothetical protein
MTNSIKKKRKRKFLMKPFFLRNAGLKDLKNL